MRRLSFLLLGVSGLFCIIMSLNSCNRESLFSEDNDTETISENSISKLTDEEFFALADFLVLLVLAVTRLWRMRSLQFHC